MAKKRGLGKSLDALLAYTEHLSVNDSSSDKSRSTNDSTVSTLSIESLQRGKYQPRRDMDPEALQELAQSIKAQGVLQPLIVRPLNAERDKFEIIAGERRFRAAKLAGLDNVPVVIRDIPDEAAVAVALIENIQRENLSPVEEAIAFERLMTEFGLTHQQVADAVGKSRTNVTNLLRLLTLPETIRALLEQGLIEMGHARTLITLPEMLQIEAVKAIMDQNLSVREAEEWVRRAQVARNRKPDEREAAIPDRRASELETSLSKQLKLKVNLRSQRAGRGKVIIHYRSQAELEHLLTRLDCVIA